MRRKKRTKRDLLNEEQYIDSSKDLDRYLKHEIEKKSKEKRIDKTIFNVLAAITAIACLSLLVAGVFALLAAELYAVALWGSITVGMLTSSILTGVFFSRYKKNQKKVEDMKIIRKNENSVYKTKNLDDPVGLPTIKGNVNQGNSPP